MSKSTHERISDDTDLEVLDPLWPKPDSPSDRDGPDTTATPEHHSATTRAASPTRRPKTKTRRPKTRRLRLLGLVIAATVAGSASTHWFDQRTSTYPQPPMAACQAAINATARLHRFQAIQLAQGIEEAWALIGGAGVPNPHSIDTSLNARLQRDAESAISRCISPATSGL
jgi:hypothetical protein